ncbi:hypothetical protein CQA53_02245 [Helicobacter didelphidarum]|uniref:RCK C-terminal domain-containing protein n=1 Tax=Helicobacter didelphidarum TaxID=2040648 RepID=A0A3D8IQA1_9HELI|nr:TrkA C-terminal domain-containing protein [Helicobacter didelphidarum]RDU67095.1 hypothetical protein CQA53_02245 [Helicobacter didelphidarum]
MKHLLLVADGDIALHFLHKIINGYSSNNFYIVLYKDSRFLPKEIPSTFRFYECDYTSSFRLDNILADDDISDAFIVLQDEQESNMVYEYLRKNYKKARIIHCVHTLNDYLESLNQKDSNLVLITETNAMASRLLLRVPNVPIIPRGFGLEKGEVMEIGVPSGSIFAHRQINTIRQTNWRIVGIYRDEKFKLATSQSVIWPGDTLLVAGDPKVLQTIYYKIKSDMGQFPSPFGREVCLIVDMRLQHKERIFFDCKEAIYLHTYLKSTKLIIKVLHPTDFNIIKELEKFNQRDIVVTIDYDNASFMQVLRSKFGKKIGLIVIGKELFAKRVHRRMLWASKIPIFCTAKNPICPKEYSNMLDQYKISLQKNFLQPNVACSFLVVIGDSKEYSDISTLIFDISKQLCIDVLVYNFDPDNHFDNEIEGEFNELSRIFDRKFTIERSGSQNPIPYLQTSQNPVLHFLPFSSAVTKGKIHLLLGTNTGTLAFMTNTNPQFFLPLSSDV